MSERRRWWQRPRSAHAAWRAAWISAILITALGAALIPLPPWALDYRLEGWTAVGVPIGLVASAVAVGIDLLTCRARGADPSLAPARIFGAFPLGLGIGLVVSSIPLATGAFDEERIPDRNGAAFLMVGAVLVVVGALLFPFAARVQRNAESGDGASRPRRKRRTLWGALAVLIALAAPLAALQLASPPARTQAAPALVVGTVGDRTVALVTFRLDTFPAPDLARVLSDGRSVQAALFDLDSGDRLWSTLLAGDPDQRYDAVPTALDGRRATVSTTDGLVALDAATGEILSTDRSAPAPDVNIPGNSFDPQAWSVTSRTVRLPGGDELEPDWATGADAVVLLEESTAEPAGAREGFVVTQSESGDDFLIQGAELETRELIGTVTSTQEAAAVVDSGAGHVALLGTNDEHQAILVVATEAGIRTIVIGAHPPPRW
ncbi:hypothetical protein [Microbacterium sp. CIAB417]|uniref:hypothetical protein n=1 Tax=Microbacterium sp. CIAB417 TaxID=2860287 RepID=UPI001FAD935E|nr:hypothetical protein [Microbacterium sp. CIAB417]